MFDLFVKDQKENSLAQLMLDADKYSPHAYLETKPFREYMVQQRRCNRQLVLERRWDGRA